MSQRGIERDDVELVLIDADADWKSREPPFRHIYARRVGDRPIHVVVEPFDHEEVVTAFVPDTRED